MEKIDTSHLNEQINVIYFQLKNIDINEKSNVSSILGCFNSIKEYLCTASEMKSNAEDLLLHTKLVLRNKESEFLQKKDPEGRQYDYKDRKNTYCMLEEIEHERLEFINKRLDRLRDDIKNVMMQLNVLQSYYKAEIKSIAT